MPEILPHPVRGTADPSSERIMPVLISIDRSVEVNESDYVLPFITSTGDEDRHGSIIDPNGWDDSFYRQNPVVLWSHQTLIPAIGKAENIKRTSTKGTCNVRFAIEAWRAEGMGNLAQQVYQLCRDGFINMGSESFIPKKWREIEAQTIPSFFAENVRYELVEKTEFSIVNVGSNRGALQIRSLLEKGAISENEATLLGLGAMLRFESPIIVRTESGVIAPKDAVAAVKPGATVRFKDTEENRADAAVRMFDGVNADGTVIEVYADGTRAAVEFLSPQAGMFRGAEVARLRVVAPAPEGWTVEPHVESKTKRVLLVADVRAKVSDILTRCCGCDSYYGTAPEPVDEETKAAEIAVLNEIASSSLEILDAAVSGWKSSEHDELRAMCKERVYSAMWMFDRAGYLLEQWYGEKIGATVPEIDFDDVERAMSEPLETDHVSGADMRLRALERVGKVFSAKNLAKIDQIITLATDLRAAADAVNEEAEDEERGGFLLHPGTPDDVKNELIRIISGSESREQDSTATIRVLASDAAPDRSAESPAPADLYFVMLAD